MQRTIQPKNKFEKRLSILKDRINLVDCFLLKKVKKKPSQQNTCFHEKHCEKNKSPTKGAPNYLCET